MAKLTPINLERKTGFFFCIAFVYTSKGTKMLTGDRASIDEYCAKHFGTVHGIRIVKNKYGDIFKDWFLFGKNEGVYLTYVDMQRLQSDGYGYGNIYKNMGVKRPCFVLHMKGYNKMLRTWRRLPKKYINWEKLIVKKKMVDTE